MLNVLKPLQKRVKTEHQDFNDDSTNKLKNNIKQSVVDIKNEQSFEKENSLLSPHKEMYYNVLWRKQSNKKNKTWQAEGILSFSNNIYSLKDYDGNFLGNCHHPSPLSIGDQLKIADKEIEVDKILSKEDYLSGKPFIHISKKEDISSPTRYVPTKKFKIPLLSSDTTSFQTLKFPQPRHNPNELGALVLPRPQIKNNQGKNIQIIDVVVDPLLSKHLRPHQREGVIFLYECVMKMREFEGQGAILADEMGLGKSLQIITLLWTLLKQSPYGSEPIIKRALIVCPVTLINNWKREFQKWIGGNEKIGLFVVDSNTNIRSFSVGNVYSIMIIGYERVVLFF